MPVLYEIARPFLFMALMAFTLGFLSFLALGAGRTAFAAQPDFYAAEPASAPAVSDPWNVAKPI